MKPMNKTKIDDVRRTLPMNLKPKAPIQRADAPIRRAQVTQPTVGKPRALRLVEKHLCDQNHAPICRSCHGCEADPRSRCMDTIVIGGRN